MSNKVPKIRFNGYSDAWVQRNLGDLSEIVRGSSPRPIQDPKWFDESSEIGWLRISDVTEQNGRIHHLEQHISEAGQAKTRVLTEPHLLLSIAATVGKPLVNYVKTGVHDGFLIFMNPKFDLEFMFQWLESYRDKWSRYGQPGSQVNLNSDLVKNQSISIPSMDEQQKLGEFFTSIDNLIAANQRKLDLLKEQKKGYLQKMFPKNGAKVPELRFAGFADDWEERKLQEVLRERNNQQPQSMEYPLVSFTVENGVTPKTDRYEREQLVVGDKSSKKYKVTVLNDIVYNPANLKFGAISRNKYGNAVFSPIYITFLVNNDVTTPEFIEMFVTRNDFIKRALKYQQGTVYERQSVSPTDLLAMNVYLPGKSEQEKIGSFFQQLDETIALHQRKLDLLKEQKKGFLQMMFV
ncbi:Type I restriction-modification system, specificity subunit S [Weissella confusa]|uniref:restriction endonuclease subunit S n=1 Tax=Weissella confusa TaxID=1583 RepID=UPI000989A2E4|nr:restriction endonuclease subunit S [Weissella confusa]SJX69484.1 Type I restriction-modification system, specificity subunit S [Weissella confusa]